MSYLLFHSKASQRTATKWMSEYDVAAWGSGGQQIHNILVKSWMIQWPADDDQFEGGDISFPRRLVLKVAAFHFQRMCG